MSSLAPLIPQGLKPVSTRSRQRSAKALLHPISLLYPILLLYPNSLLYANALCYPKSQATSAQLALPHD
jgi:hypothetical protein